MTTCGAMAANSQYKFFTPEGSFAIEVSMENTNLKRLPIYRNEITSLLVVDNYILGGTTATDDSSPFVFTASLNKREVVDILDVSRIVKNQQKISSGFVEGNEGQHYVGTIPQSLNESGHLLAVHLEIEGEIEIRDLGIPVPGEGVYSLTGDDSNETLYGLTYPSGYFFSFDIKSGRAIVFEETVPSDKEVNSLKEQFSLQPDDYLSRALILDSKGNVYGSLPYGKLFCYDSKSESIIELNVDLPFVWGRRSLGQIQCWLKTREGRIYGANRADGQLFEFKAETHQIVNLGKPLMFPGIDGLVQGADGKIYGIGGRIKGYTHLFSYDEGEGFIDYGNPQFMMKSPGIEQGIEWRGFQLSTITTSEDRNYIVMGEGESLSQLMVFSITKK